MTHQKKKFFNSISYYRNLFNGIKQLKGMAAEETPAKKKILIRFGIFADTHQDIILNGDEY